MAAPTRPIETGGDASRGTGYAPSVVAATQYRATQPVQIIRAVCTDTTKAFQAPNHKVIPGSRVEVGPDPANGGVARFGLSSQEALAGSRGSFAAGSVPRVLDGIHNTVQIWVNTATVNEAVMIYVYEPDVRR